MSDARLTVTYAVRADRASIAERAEALALEQSVEVPIAAVRDARVRDEVVARVASIAPRDDGRHDVRIAMAIETTGDGTRLAMTVNPLRKTDTISSS